MIIEYVGVGKPGTKGYSKRSRIKKSETVFELNGKTDRALAHVSDPAEADRILHNNIEGQKVRDDRFVEVKEEKATSTKEG